MKSFGEYFLVWSVGAFRLRFGGLNEKMYTKSLLWYLAQRKDSINISFITVTVIVFTPNLLVKEIMPLPSRNKRYPVIGLYGGLIHQPGNSKL